MSTDRPKWARYCSCRANCCCCSTWNLDCSAIHCLWKYLISSICLTIFSDSRSSTVVGGDDPCVSFASELSDDTAGDRFCKPTTAASVSRPLFLVLVFSFSMVMDVEKTPNPIAGSTLDLLCGLNV